MDYSSSSKMGEVVLQIRDLFVPFNQLILSNHNVVEHLCQKWVTLQVKKWDSLVLQIWDLVIPFNQLILCIFTSHELFLYDFIMISSICFLFKGEEQKKLDVLSNEVFIKALVSSGRTVSH